MQIKWDYMSINRYLISILIGICFTFCGCTVSTHIYIKNSLDVSKEIIIIKRNDKVSNYFYYSDSNQKINLDLAKKLEKKLKLSLINDSNYYLKIPAHSIVLLDISHNFVSQKFITIKLNGKNLIEEGYFYTDKDSETKKEGLSFIRCYIIQ